VGWPTSPNAAARKGWMGERENEMMTIAVTFVKGKVMTHAIRNNWGG